MDSENKSNLQGKVLTGRKVETGVEFDLELHEFWYKGKERNERQHVVTIFCTGRVEEAARKEVRIGRVVNVTGKARQIRYEENGKKQSRLVFEAVTVSARDNGGTVNSHRFRGVLGRDPELRSTPAGTQVCDFSLALSEPFTDENGNASERTDWLDFTAWGGVAEKISLDGMKGNFVLVDCRASQDTWQDKDTGEQRSRVKFIADRVRVFAASRGERKDRGPKASEGETREYSDEDVPPEAEAAKFNWQPVPW